MLVGLHNLRLDLGSGGILSFIVFIMQDRIWCLVYGVLESRKSLEDQLNFAKFKLVIP